MTPFEDLIHALGDQLGIPLTVDSHQSCLVEFEDKVRIQIDLDGSGDQILMGTQLGTLTPGPYRLRIFRQAMRVNGLSTSPRGILAFSDKNDTLVLFQYFPIAVMTGEKLAPFLDLFHAHALSWKTSLEKGEIPQLEDDAPSTSSGFFGLTP